MNSKKKIQLVALNGAIVTTNIAVFSKVFFGLSLFKGNSISLVIAWLDILVSILAFFKGNLSILKKQEMHVLTQDIKNLNDCISVFEEAMNNGDVFDENITKNIDQIKRFKRKYETINDILLQKFSSNEMTFQKFSDVLKEVENVIYMNMRSILNKISAFDVDEYEAIQRNKININSIPKEKIDIYNQYINFVNESTNINEEILLKLDKMILEISKYNTIEGEDIKKMPVIAEIDALIKNANLYK